MMDNKLILRATLKLFAGSAILWLAYILTAGFFAHDNRINSSAQEFDLSSLADNNAIYFSVNTRELLVIKIAGEYRVFWAQDPNYGCRLKFLTTFIKPVCINIKYNLHGYSINKNQQLLSPNYKITLQNTLQIY